MLQPLSNFRRNEFSQNGEDGVLEEVFRRIGATNRYFCEFGAWDGITFSNCRGLLDQGWSGLMIEGEPDRFIDLKNTAAAFPNLQVANAWVTWQPGSAGLLDDLLAEHDAPVDLDLLSIDIDSSDYQVWRSLVRYRPRVVIIEISSSRHPGDPSVHGDDGIVMTGFGPMVALGREKGYVPVLHTGNLIFVRSDAVTNIGPLPADDVDLFDPGWMHRIERWGVRLSAIRRRIAGRR